MERLGKKRWRRAVGEVVPALMAALQADYVVLGGGNAKRLKDLPPGSRLSNNLTTFRGSFRLWHVDDVRTLSGEERLPDPPPRPSGGSSDRPPAGAGSPPQSDDDPFAGRAGTVREGPQNPEIVPARGRLTVGGLLSSAAGGAATRRPGPSGPGG
jgi:hypothetical protein